MTTPEHTPDPADPGNGKPAPPPPPDPGKGGKTDPGKTGDGDGQSAEELRDALSVERKARREVESKLSKLEQQHMSEQEKAIAAAKAEGRAEALVAAGKRLAAAEFKAAAAGKIADPSAALEVIELGRFVGEDGEPDARAIAAVVDKLAAALPVTNGHAPGRVPPGPRGADGEDVDFVSAAARGRL